MAWPKRRESKEKEWSNSRIRLNHNLEEKYRTGFKNRKYIYSLHFSRLTKKEFFKDSLSFTLSTSSSAATRGISRIFTYPTDR